MIDRVLVTQLEMIAIFIVVLGYLLYLFAKFLAYQKECCG